MTQRALNASHHAEVASSAIDSPATRQLNSRRNSSNQMARDERLNKRNRQPPAEIRTQTESCPESGHPVQERGLFEPRRAPKFWGDEVAGTRHRAADRSIARFVRSVDPKAIQLIEIERRNSDRKRGE